MYLNAPARHPSAPLFLAALAALAGEASAQQAAPAGGRSPGPAAADLAAAPAGATAGGPAGAERGPVAAPDRPLAMPTVTGSTGLVRVASAHLPPAGTFRAQALYEYFAASPFLCGRRRPCGEGAGRDETTRAGLALAASAAATDFLEAYVALRSYSTSNDRGSPRVLQALGDGTLGLKAALPYAPDRLVYVGGDLQLSLLQGSGGVGVDPAALGGRARAALTVDLRPSPVALPLLVHVNLGYRLDNSGALVAAAEASRGAPVSRIERFGLGINRVDFVEAGLGAELALRPGAVVRSLRPFVEYSFDGPVNRQGYACARARLSPGDGCLGERSGFAAAPSRLTWGARVNPWLPGLVATAAVDVGVSGTSTFIDEVAPQAPWTLWLGVGYAVRASASAPAPAPAPPPAPSPPAAAAALGPPDPRRAVRGFVHEAGGRGGIAEAAVRLEGGDGGGLLTGPSGHFVTAPLAPGRHRFRVRAQGYYEAVCEALVAPTPPASGAAPAGESAVDCPLEPGPRSGTVRGRVVGGDGAAAIAGARVVAVDAAGIEHAATADANGSFRLEGLAPGPARVRASHDGHFDGTALADVRARDEVGVSVALRRRPASPNVTVGRRELALKRPVRFESNGAKILPESAPLLEEIADVLVQNPHLRRVEVQAHTDASGPPARDRALSQERAEAVRERLVALGVAPERLTAKGYGDDRPLAPNVTAANRARNRRVAFVVLEQGRPGAGTGAP
jgi:outer membrane protein OmpA-like peptidoglycan-associated protein